MGRREVPGRVMRASDVEVGAFVDAYEFWSVEGCKLHREYVFRSFTEAFGFMREVALFVESADHHPEWFNVYRRVVVDLTTHEVGGISVRDFELARRMEEVALRLGV